MSLRNLTSLDLCGNSTVKQMLVKTDIIVIKPVTMKPQITPIDTGFNESIYVLRYKQERCHIN